MYFSRRSALVRNLAVALVNGAVTLVILLIAPLGLMAVIINTALVMMATYATATIGDRVLRYLQADTPLRGELISPPAGQTEGRPGEMVRRGDDVQQR